ncbi:MAG: XylR family transcriptional regulator [Planctomycetes bacterium]|jgi:LacI family transcriptional regulator|nr:XylR family transcriptional regulator [Planctomycetota bacterium]
MPTIYRVILLIERARAYGRGLLRGIARYTSIHGPWLPRIEPEFYRLSRRQSAEWMKELERADGVIAHLADTQTIESIVRSGIPAVIAGIREPAVQAHAVMTNDEAIAQMALDYLLNRGFRRLAYCGLDDMYWSRQRGRTFLHQACQAGCDVRVYEPPARKRPRTDEAERPLLADWLQSLPKPTALLACNDDRGKQILAACKIAGLEVPDEIAILGIDNDELVCELQHPQLSSIALSVEAAGYTAAALLGDLMAGRGSHAARETIVVSPLYVVERQSTDVLAMEDRDVAAGLRFIREHAREGIQVQDVAQASALSRRAVQQRFRRVLGRSVHDEIKRTRIDQMARLLVTTNLPMKEIARLLQCAEVKNLARYFRQQTGLTPAEYRKRYGAK